MAHDHRISTAWHTGIGTSAGTLNPIIGALAGVKHKLGAMALDNDDDRSLGGYVSKSATGGAGLGAVGGALMGPALLNLILKGHLPGPLKNRLVQHLAGSGIGAGFAGASGALEGVLGKISDKVGE